MSRIAALLPVLAALVVSTACGSTPDPIAPLSQPYRIVLLPIEGVETALAAPVREGEAQEGDEVPFALEPDVFRNRITNAIVNSGVFSNVIVVGREELTTDEFTDTVMAAAPRAKAEAADLIMRVRVNSARLRDLGANSSKFWSTFTWFMVPLPIWFVDDRTYATSLTVQAEMYDPADPIKPTASVVASSGEEEMDLWDRGALQPTVVVIPPPWVEGNLEKVSETLTERAVNHMMTELVDELRTREIPSRFELDLEWEGNDLVVVVRTRRPLRALTVLAGAQVLRTWAEDETSDLLDTSGPKTRLIAYRARVEDGAGRADYLRVLVEDEGGGREVRTIPSPSTSAKTTEAEE